MNIVDKIAELLQGQVLICLDHFDLVGDKVEIVYSAQIGEYPNRIKYNDLLEVAPIEEISKPEVRNETDTDERYLMIEADVKQYLYLKTREHQHILNALNVSNEPVKI